MEAVAASDEIAGDFVRLTIFGEADPRGRALEIVDADVVHLEAQMPAALQPRFDQVLDHFVLSVDGDGAASERVQVDAMGSLVEAQLDAVVDHPLAPHSLADTGFIQQIDGALLQHTCADPLFHVPAGVTFDHHRLDPLQV